MPLTPSILLLLRRVAAFTGVSCIPVPLRATGSLPQRWLAHRKCRTHVQNRVQFHHSGTFVLPTPFSHLSPSRDTVARIIHSA